MFTFRRETDYAIQFIIFLAKCKKCFCSLKEFAEKENISFFFMQKIARRLQAGKIIEAGKGVKGGYRLRIKKINLKEIVEVIEGKIGLLPCLKQTNFCCAKQGKNCELKSIINKLNKDFCQKIQAIKIV